MCLCLLSNRVFLKLGEKLIRFARGEMEAWEGIVSPTVKISSFRTECYGAEERS